MHRELIKYATPEQLKDFVLGSLDMIKETNHDLYEDLEMYLYKMIYGCHFSEWLLKKATSEMKNEDGTTGEHWTLEQTNSVARSKGVMFSHYNQYDFNYVMNMLYSDYYGSVPNDTDTYYKMAVKFLNDKDSKEGKAFHYYYKMVK